MKNVIYRNAMAEQYICAARKKFICDNEISGSDSKLFIGHISDIHGDNKRFENALTLFEYYKPDFVIHTGDTVKWNNSDDMSFFLKGVQSLSVPMYNCIGNHDTFDNNGGNTNKYLHKKIIAPLPNINSNCEEGGYYYVDFESKKIRLIVLNNYEYECPEPSIRDKYAVLQKQCDWLVNKLKEAAEKEYGVIIASHEEDEPIPAAANESGFCQRFAPCPWGIGKEKPHIVSDIVNAFQKGTELKKEYRYEQINKKVQIECKFDKKGEFICYLSGHRHGDYAGYLESYPNQLSLCITCSGCFPAGYHNIGEEVSDLPRIPETVTEDVINFYIIDREEKTLTVVRAGACVNDEFKTRLTATFKYEQ